MPQGAHHGSPNQERDQGQAFKGEAMSEDRISKADDKKGDVGPWVVRRDETRQWRICSENFKHDVELIITGDFKDEAETVEYAADIARRLSAPQSAGAAMTCKARGVPCETPGACVTDGCCHHSGEAAHAPSAGAGRSDDYRDALVIAKQALQDIREFTVGQRAWQRGMTPEQSYISRITGCEQIAKNAQSRIHEMLGRSWNELGTQSAIVACPECGVRFDPTWDRRSADSCISKSTK